MSDWAVRKSEFCSGQQLSRGSCFLSYLLWNESISLFVSAAALWLSSFPPSLILGENRRASLPSETGSSGKLWVSTSCHYFTTLCSDRLVAAFQLSALSTLLSSPLPCPGTPFPPHPGLSLRPVLAHSQCFFLRFFSVAPFQKPAVASEVLSCLPGPVAQDLQPGCRPLEPAISLFCAGKMREKTKRFWSGLTAPVWDLFLFSESSVPGCEDRWTLYDPLSCNPFFTLLRTCVGIYH